MRKKIGIACIVLGFVLAGIFTWRIIVTAPGAPKDVSSGPVELKKEGLTIWASGTGAAICTAKDSAGSEVALTRPSGSQTVTINGDSWHAIASSVQRVPAGTYTVVCEAQEAGVRFGVTPKTNIAAFVLSIIGAVASFLVFVAVGSILLAVGRKRRTGPTFPHQPVPQQPGNAAPGGQYPRQPPGNYPPYNPSPNPDDPGPNPNDPPRS